MKHEPPHPTLPLDAAGPARRFVPAAWFALWLAVVVGATAQLVRSANAAGDAGAPPDRWPERSELAPDAGGPTLVLFAHPRCPCTRASLGELEILLAAAPGRLRAHVVFARPAGVPARWEQADLWRQAAALPGATVRADEGGAEARRFGARTSGHALLFDADGRRQFSGGLTRARGHAGDNAGRAALLALARGTVPAHTRTAVFGCPLFEAACAAESEATCQP
jgi:hypothetical protein